MPTDESRDRPHGLPDLAVALVTLLGTRAGIWSGTSAELHELLPSHAADPTRLAKALAQAADDLIASGIRIERRRQPGTGARIIMLAQRAGTSPAPTASVTLDATTVTAARSVAPEAVTLNVAPLSVTLQAAASPAATGPLDPDRPLFPCPACGRRDWRWHQSPRRRASRWCCSTCELQP